MAPLRPGNTCLLKFALTREQLISPEPITGATPSFKEVDKSTPVGTRIAVVAVLDPKQYAEERSTIQESLLFQLYLDLSQWCMPEEDKKALSASAQQFQAERDAGGYVPNVGTGSDHVDDPSIVINEGLLKQIPQYNPDTDPLRKGLDVSIDECVTLVVSNGTPIHEFLAKFDVLVVVGHDKEVERLLDNKSIDCSMIFLWNCFSLNTVETILKEDRIAAVSSATTFVCCATFARKEDFSCSAVAYWMFHHILLSRTDINKINGYDFKSPDDWTDADRQEKSVVLLRISLDEQRRVSPENLTHLVVMKKSDEQWRTLQLSVPFETLEEGGDKDDTSPIRSFSVPNGKVKTPKTLYNVHKSTGDYKYKIVGSTLQYDSWIEMWNDSFKSQKRPGKGATQKELDEYCCNDKPPEKGHGGFLTGGHLTDHRNGQVNNGGTCYMLPLCNTCNSQRGADPPAFTMKTEEYPECLKLILYKVKQ